MFGFGVPQLILLLVIVLLVLGPGKLPQLGASLGGAIRGFKKAQEDDDPKVINAKAEEKTD